MFFLGIKVRFVPSGICGTESLKIAVFVLFL
jgi:hypothetical protein